MSSSRQKDIVKETSTEIAVEQPKRIYRQNEPIRYKVRRIRLTDIGDDLKRIYRIKN